MQQRTDGRAWVWIRSRPRAVQWQWCCQPTNGGMGGVHVTLSVVFFMLADPATLRFAPMQPLRHLGQKPGALRHRLHHKVHRNCHVDMAWATHSIPLFHSTGPHRAIPTTSATSSPQTPSQAIHPHAHAPTDMLPSARSTQCPSRSLPIDTC